MSNSTDAALNFSSAGAMPDMGDIVVQHHKNKFATSAIFLGSPRDFSQQLTRIFPPALHISVSQFDSNEAYVILFEPPASSENDNNRHVVIEDDEDEDDEDDEEGGSRARRYYQYRRRRHHQQQERYPCVVSNEEWRRQQRQEGAPLPPHHFAQSSFSDLLQGGAAGRGGVAREGRGFKKSIGRAIEKGGEHYNESLLGTRLRSVLGADRNSSHYSLYSAGGGAAGAAGEGVVKISKFRDVFGNKAIVHATLKEKKHRGRLHSPSRTVEMALTFFVQGFGSHDRRRRNSQHFTTACKYDRAFLLPIHKSFFGKYGAVAMFLVGTATGCAPLAVGAFAAGAAATAMEE